MSVYRKNTHTDRYLPFESHHPAHVKRGVVRSLVRRAENVSTHNESLKKEMGHLRMVLRANGYPSNLVQPSKPRTADDPEKDVEDDEDKPIATAIIPYSKGMRPIIVESVYCDTVTCSCDSCLVGTKKLSIIMFIYARRPAYQRSVTNNSHKLTSAYPRWARILLGGYKIIPFIDEGGHLVLRVVNFIAKPPLFLVHYSIAMYGGRGQMF